MKPRHRLSRRDFLKITTLGSAGLVLAACGAPATTEAPAAEAPAAEAPAAEPTAAPAAEPTAAPAAQATEAPAPAAEASTGDVTLSVSHWWGDGWMNAGGTVTQDALGIKLDSQSVPYGEFAEKILSQIAGGVAADIIQTDAGFRGPFMTGDVFIPLNDALTAASIDMSKWWVDPVREVGFEGKILGLEQFAMQALIIHINKDLIKDSGIKLPEWGTPEFDTWKWDDYVAFLKQVTKTSSSGETEIFGITGSAIAATTMDYNIIQRGGELFDEGVWDYQEKETMINSSEAQAAVQAGLDLILKDKVAPEPDTENAIEGGLYRAGRAVSTVSWSTTSGFPDMSFEQTYIHFPWVTRRCHPVGGNSLHVNKTSKNIDKAIETIIFKTTNVESRKAFQEAQGTANAYAPLETISDMADGPSKTTVLVGLSRIKGFSECEPCTENVTLWSRGKGRKGSFFQNTVTAAIESALNGEPVAEALNNAKTTIDAELQAG